MSIEDFQLIDETTIDTSIVKRDYTKIYHQHRANLNDSNQNVEFIWGENNNYHQVGNSYLQYDITVRRHDNAPFTDASVIRLVNNAFAYCIKEATLSFTGGSEIEQNKYVGPISTIMRVLTNKDGDLMSYFDNINETQAGINNSSLKQILIDNHTVAANKGKIVGQLPLEHIFGFCKTFKKITKGLGFQLTLKTPDLQNILYTTILDDIDVTINSLHLFVPTLIPDAATQAMFNNSIKDNFKISFDSWTSLRNIVDTDLEHQVDIGSAQNINSPKYLIAAHQTIARAGGGKTQNNAIFDSLNVRKYYVEIDGIRYPKDAVDTEYGVYNYFDQHRDIESFFKEYVGEPLLKPFISYPDVKTKYPFQVIDLRHQVDHINPKKIQLFEEYRADPANARLFMVLIRHRELVMISDGNKIVSANII